MLRPVPGTGLGLLRNAPEAPSRELRRAARREIRARAPRATPARAHEGEPALDDPPADVPRLRRREALRRRRQRDRRAPLPRALHVVGVQLATRSTFRCCAARSRRSSTAPGFLPASHDQKDLIAILETYPRDDLFQIDVDALYDERDGHPASAGAAAGAHVRAPRDLRPVRVVPRVPAPRPVHDPGTRSQIAEILIEAFGARSHEWNTRLSASRCSRVCTSCCTSIRATPTPDRPRRARSARRGRDARVGRRPPRHARRRARRGGRARDPAPVGRRVSRSHTATTSTRGRRSPTSRCSRDLDERGGLAVRLGVDGDHRADLKLYGAGAQPSLSDVLPEPHQHGRRRRRRTPVRHQPARARTALDQALPAARARACGRDRRGRQLFEDAFLAVLERHRRRRRLQPARAVRRPLVARGVACCARTAGTSGRLGTLYSQAYIEDALAAHPDIARGLVELFVTRLDPVAERSGRHRPARRPDRGRASTRVETLDEDRILRSLLHLVLATLRTNWFQTRPDGALRASVVIKFDPSRDPRPARARCPMFEIFVYSPRVEGVHLRAGRVARGGIRWSDRREDFRTEILGLMKAQRVKNVVIVPGGAKGGFVVKRPPVDREQLPGRSRGLLPRVHQWPARRDRQPPATAPSSRRHRSCATTATTRISSSPPTRAPRRSPTSRTRSRSRAASGSATRSRRAVRPGYDHKEIGITAKGAWVSVTRHFRQLGIDVHAHRLHRGRHRRHVGRRVRQRHAPLRAHPARRRVRPPPHLPRPGSRPGARRSRNARACSRCPDRRGPTTTHRSSRRAAACTRVPPRRSRSRPRSASGSASPRSRDHAHPERAGVLPPYSSG